MNNNIPQNIEVTHKYLNNLEKSILSNVAEIKDYEGLEDVIFQYFNFENFISNEMKKYNIYSFEHFINERKTPIEKRNIFVDSTLIGVLTGIISVLRDFIDKKK